MKNLFKSIFIIIGILFLVSASANTKVYITKSGDKYHKSSCSYLRNSKIEISLKDAIDQGYTACSRCKPPKTYKKSSGEDEGTDQSEDIVGYGELHLRATKEELISLGYSQPDKGFLLVGEWWLKSPTEYLEIENESIEVMVGASTIGDKVVLINIVEKNKDNSKKDYKILSDYIHSKYSKSIIETEKSNIIILKDKDGDHLIVTNITGQLIIQYSTSTAYEILYGDKENKI
jgi:hypothetical protein